MGLLNIDDPTKIEKNPPYIEVEIEQPDFERLQHLVHQRPFGRIDISSTNFGTSNQVSEFTYIDFDHDNTVNSFKPNWGYTVCGIVALTNKKNLTSPNGIPNLLSNLEGIGVRYYMDESNDYSQYPIASFDSNYIVYVLEYKGDFYELSYNPTSTDSKTYVNICCLNQIPNTHIGQTLSESQYFPKTKLVNLETLLTNYFDVHKTIIEYFINCSNQQINTNQLSAKITFESEEKAFALLDTNPIATLEQKTHQLNIHYLSELFSFIKNRYTKMAQEKMTYFGLDIGGLLLHINETNDQAIWRNYIFLNRHVKRKTNGGYDDSFELASLMVGQPSNINPYSRYRLKYILENIQGVEARLNNKHSDTKELVLIDGKYGLLIRFGQSKDKTSNISFHLLATAELTSNSIFQDAYSTLYNNLPTVTNEAEFGAAVMAFQHLYKMAMTAIYKELDYLKNGKVTEIKQDGLRAIDKIKGQPEAMKEVHRLLQVIKNPEILESKGIRPIKGILLHGQKGTGKTSIAKAIAEEADATFLVLNTTTIKTMWYGETSNKLQAFFDEAKNIAATGKKVIIFIDEMDSLVPSRGRLYQTDADIVSIILRNLDGIDKLNNIIIIGATNLPSNIDPAILRPERIDKIIELKLPDLIGREEILLIRAQNAAENAKVPLEKLFEMPLGFNFIANITEGFNGAEVAEIIRASLEDAAFTELETGLPYLATTRDLFQVAQKIVNSRRNLKSHLND